MSVSSRTIWIGIALSIVLHGATGALLRAAVPETHAPMPEPAISIDFEYTDIAPEPPKAEELEGEDPEGDGDGDGADDSENKGEAEDDSEMASGTIEPARPELPLDPSDPEDDESIAEAPMDAGVPPADDDKVAANDEPGSDAGPSTLADLAVAGTDAEVEAGDKFPGTQANLLAYMPEGDKITGLIRFDRMRGTKWAAPGEKVLSPLPDYQTLVGGRDVSLSDAFESMVISTPSPRDVSSTVLVVHTAYSDADMRAFLDQKKAPVRWSPSAGGAKGDRKAGPLVYPGDRRVFLQPYPHWAVLAEPHTLGDALDGVPGDVDSLEPDAATLPTWVTGVRDIEAESGTTDGPVVIVTFRKLEDSYEIPNLGVLPGPERMTATLQIASEGLKLRGNMRFSDAAKAAEFVTTARKLRDEFVGTRLGELLLNKVHAYAALEGLTLRQSGARVSYATSVSDQDGLGLLEFAAGWLDAYFTDQRAAATKPKKSKTKESGGGQSAPPAAPADKGPATAPK